MNLRMNISKVSLFMLIVCFVGLQSFQEPPKTIIGQRILDFKLQNIDNKYVSLSDYKKAKGFIVVFTCNHCPFAKLYPERLNLLNKKFTPLGIPLIAISSTDTSVYADDCFDKMQEKAKQEKFNFPYLIDPSQVVAKNFWAQKTPQAYVIWKVNGQWIVKYSGAIDDNGMEPAHVKNRYTENAVNALLAGKEVPLKETKSVGCQLHYKK